MCARVEDFEPKLTNLEGLVKDLLGIKVLRVGGLDNLIKEWFRTEQDNLIINYQEALEAARRDADKSAESLRVMLAATCRSQLDLVVAGLKQDLAKVRHDQKILDRKLDTMLDEIATEAHSELRVDRHASNGATQLTPPSRTPTTPHSSSTAFPSQARPVPSGPVIEASAADLLRAVLQHLPPSPKDDHTNLGIVTGTQCPKDQSLENRSYDLSTEIAPQQEEAPVQPSASTVIYQPKDVLQPATETHPVLSDQSPHPSAVNGVKEAGTPDMEEPQARDVIIQTTAAGQAPDMKEPQVYPVQVQADDAIIPTTAAGQAANGEQEAPSYADDLAETAIEETSTEETQSDIADNELQEPIQRLNAPRTSRSSLPRKAKSMADYKAASKSSSKQITVGLSRHRTLQPMSSSRAKSSSALTRAPKARPRAAAVQVLRRPHGRIDSMQSE
jgi:hypothetical protein